MAAWPSFRIYTDSFTHLVPLSDSLSNTVASDQSITWFFWTAWSVRADIFRSIRFDLSWLLVKALALFASTSVLCSLILLQVFFQFHRRRSYHNFRMESCKHNQSFVPCLVCPSGAPRAVSYTHLRAHE